MGPTCRTACLLILGLYIPFQLVETFYFNIGENDRNEHTQEIFRPFIDRPYQIDQENEREDEMNSSNESDMINVLPFLLNKTEKPGLSLLQEQGLGCDEVREERFRCCRVYDQMIEAWWCPERRPFCCHQGTYCAVCCTPDELRRTEASQPPASCQQGRRSSAADRHPPTEITVDGSWFWNGMKAAWMTMFVVLLASLLCTCVAYKCIKYIVTIVNEEDSDLEEEYLAYHFDSLGLVGTEDRQTGRQAVSRALLPPKYSDINFIPVQPEATVGAVIPGEPPPQYSSDPETETERETLQTAAETGAESGPETARPASAPPPAGQL